MKTFEPRTTVPGAERVNDLVAFTPVPLYDRRGRPVWNMPDNKRLRRTVRHFKSMASMFAFERDEISYDEATREVTIYRGMTMRMWNKLRGDIKRQHRRDSKHAKMVAAAKGAA